MILHRGDESVTLWHGDCHDVLRELADCSVDSVVTDPPYGLGFMGKEWDSGKSFVERKAAKGNTFDHVGGNHNPSNSADAARTRRSENAKFGAWCEDWTAECLRVLKPGGHLLAFGGSRTWHRLAAAVEDAGFEIRDSIAWLYGSGFPKSLDVSKAIDKLDAVDERAARALRFTAWMREHLTAQQIDAATGTNMGGHYVTAKSQPAVATVAHLDMLRPLLPEVPEWVEAMCRQRTVESENFKAREVVQERTMTQGGGTSLQLRMGEVREVRADITAPATPAAHQWQGWGTALKPAFEPVVVGRKPLAGGTVAANVLAHGTGALNIDGCRVGSEERTYSTDSGMNARRHAHDTRPVDYGRGKGESATVSGRWPANVVLDESQAAALDEQSGTLTSGANPTRRGSDGDRTVLGAFGGQSDANPQRGVDKGGASRFFYVAKAPKSERPRTDDGTAHPTVKPLALMRWLVRLVTPPGGTVLEPFAGSGTTVEACLLEGFHCIAIEREADYLPLIEARIARVGAATVVREPDLFDLDGVGA